MTVETLPLPSSFCPAHVTCSHSNPGRVTEGYNFSTESQLSQSFFFFLNLRQCLVCLRLTLYLWSSAPISPVLGLQACSIMPSLCGTVDQSFYRLSYTPSTSFQTLAKCLLPEDLCLTKQLLQTLAFALGFLVPLPLVGLPTPSPTP